MLEPGECEAVRGDVAESGETAGQALRDVLGLVARRQADLWQDWRPWLALIGVVGLAGVMLIQFSVTVSRIYDLYLWIIWNYGVMDKAILDQTGLTLRHGIVRLACYSSLLVSWSWTAGFVLGSLSRRTIWVNGVLFCLVWLLFPSARSSVSLPSAMSTVVFVLPLIWGVHQGLRRSAPELGQAIFLAIAIASLSALQIRTEGWALAGVWRTMPYSLPRVLVSWPAAYMLATATWRRRHGENII